MLQMDRGRLSPTGLVDIRRAEMAEMVIADDTLVIGAATTATALSQWEQLPAEAAGLWEAAATLSVPGIRNMASVGGNIANASPAADMVPPIMAMGGEVEVRRGDDRRLIRLAELAHGPGKTSLKQGDLVTKVIIPRWAQSSFHHFSKLGFRDAQVIAVVSLAFSCEFEGEVVSRIGIALGSVAATVKRAETVEAFLLGKKLTREVGTEAVRLLGKDISPIDDVRSEAEFRLQVAKNYLADALARAYVHSQGDDARGLSDEARLDALKDPAPRPPSLAGARTRLGFALPVPKLRIVSTSASAYEVRAEPFPPNAEQESSAQGATTMAARKKKTTRKKAAKKKTTKRKAKKKVAKKKTKKKTTKRKAKKKTTKRKAKKKVAKKKTKKKAKKKATKRKAKKKVAKKKTKKKATKRKAKKKVAKKKTKKKAKKKATKRKAKKKTTKRKAKRKTTRR